LKTAESTLENLKYRCVLGLLISFTTMSQAQAEKFILHSDTIDQDYSISITLPEDYSPDTNYPLIVFTDAMKTYASKSVTETNTEELQELTETLLANGTIPKVVLVGIGYPARNYRVRDFTPVQVPNQPLNMSGGANKFA